MRSRSIYNFEIYQYFFPKMFVTCNIHYSAIEWLVDWLEWAILKIMKINRQNSLRAAQQKIWWKRRRRKKMGYDSLFSKKKQAFLCSMFANTKNIFIMKICISFGSTNEKWTKNAYFVTVVLELGVHLKDSKSPICKALMRSTNYFRYNSGSSLSSIQKSVQINWK